jgi:hypothetical protein
MLGRGPRVPKRLVEAWTGMVVARSMPTATLWASTFRASDGLGVAPAENLLLLQCSPAERRSWGLSMRVSRKMLGAYMESSHLRAWGDRAQFVLASLTQTNSGSERCQRPLLWAVGAQDLTDFTDRQGKGTVNHEGLDELITLGCAKPLGSLLEDVAYRGQLVAPNYSPPSRRESGFGDSLWFHPFNLSAPSPLGLALVL